MFLRPFSHSGNSQGKIILIFTVLLFSHAMIAMDQPENTNKNPPLENKKTELDFSQKNPLTEQQILKKKEDGYFTFLAGPASSPDTGTGATAVLLYYYNGKKDDILFPYTPYLHNIGFLASYQSRGYASFAIMWDAPYFLHSAFRIYADLWFNINPVSQFYGIGSKTLSPLADPQGKTFNRMKDYDNSLRAITQGNTNSYYNYYYARWFDGKLMAQRDFGGGIFRILGGYLLQHDKIEDYSNKTVLVTSPDGATAEAVNGNTMLYNHFLNGQIRGFNGGWANALMIGLAMDNRDFEPNPRKGMFHDIAFGYHSHWLGSDFEYGELTVGSRFYFSPFKNINLVFASRMAASYKFGDVPFSGLTTIQFTNKKMNSIGDIRGYRNRRYMGYFVTLADLEARLMFFNWKWGEQEFDLSITPFLDLISIFDRPQDFSFSDWKAGYGAGLRLSWNQATVIRFDFGFSSEDFGFYLMINQLY